MMTDPELEAIRQKRLGELASQESGSAGLPSSVISKLGNKQAGPSEDEAKKAESEEARQVEDMLLRMAQTGQLRGRVTEEQLISVLDQLEQAESGSTKSLNNAKKITYVRKDAFDDDDWDL